jgi:hypothetical protein
MLQCKKYGYNSFPENLITQDDYHHQMQTLFKDTAYKIS